MYPLKKLIIIDSFQRSHLYVRRKIAVIHFKIKDFFNNTCLIIRTSINTFASRITATKLLGNLHSMSDICYNMLVKDFINADMKSVIESSQTGLISQYT